MVGPFPSVEGRDGRPGAPLPLSLSRGGSCILYNPSLLVHPIVERVFWVSIA